ncbi:Protein of unknown function [Terribacillus aidingensis]|uniref:DUF4064 domain-containing protein n=1 Tax=Terribacillus aidingensis TaxID=586416 RepID=A0A285NQ61_9BACI|nr:DUF4064 domain-containing protein [Terribacillus aidingensis]SNZ11589.1 Protein of unknown function [Terribacillus aidingensis]
MSRTTEFVLGLIGGILGFFGAIFALIMGSVDAALSETGTSSLTGLGWFAFLFSTLAIIGSIVVKTKAKLGGILLIISAVGGLISISFFYLISAVLIAIAGFMGVFRKNKSVKQAA